MRNRSTSVSSAWHQPADLALRDPTHTEGFDQFVDASRADSLDVRFLDDRHQRAFATPSRLEQGRVVPTVAHPRHTQFDAANACIPGPIAVAVALASAIAASLIALSTKVLRHFDFHDLLRQNAHALA